MRKVLCNPFGPVHGLHNECGCFAANPITKDTEQIGSTIVKTIGQGPTDPDVPGANEDYTVTICGIDRTVG